MTTRSAPSSLRSCETTFWSEPTQSRRLLAPEPVDEPVGGDDLARVEEQEREQRPLIAAAEPNRRPLVENLERAEDPELHRGFVAP